MKKEKLKAWAEALALEFPLITFDADGTLTPSRDGATGPAIYQLLPNVGERSEALCAAGVKLAIASNQSGNRSISSIEAQLMWTADAIGADIIKYAQLAETRKPNPHMLLAIADYFELPVSQILMVGDQETDHLAAKNAGCAFRRAKKFFGWPSLNWGGARAGAGRKPRTDGRTRRQVSVYANGAEFAEIKSMPTTERRRRLLDE